MNQDITNLAEVLDGVRCAPSSLTQTARRAGLSRAVSDSIKSGKHVSRTTLRTLEDSLRRDYMEAEKTVKRLEEARQIISKLLFA